MRVLIVTNQFPSDLYPYKGSFVFNQTEVISKKIEKVIVLSPNYGNEESVVEKNDIVNYRFKTFTKSTKDPLLRNLFNGLQGIIRLVMFIIFQTYSIVRICKKYKIDIIHAHWILPSGFSSYIASLLTKKKVIVTTNGSDLTYCGKVPILNKFVCYVLSKISMLVCVSKKLETLSNFYCKSNFRKRTVYIGVPKHILSQVSSSKNGLKSTKEKKLRLIFAGSLYPIKGIDYLLRSINILSKRKSNFVLDLVGSGEKISEYKSYVEKNNLEEFVIFHGFKTHGETINLINEADIAIQSSLSEGLSVFIQESIFLGKPIVATNVGGTSEIVIDTYNGFLVEPKNPEKLAEKIDLLLSDSEKIALFSKNSQLIAKEKLSLEKNMTEIVKIYADVLRKR